MRILLFMITTAFLCNAQRGIPKGAEKLLSEQERQEIDSMKQIDWLSYKYTYLDNDYQINIPDQVFQQGLKDGKFIKERITKYTDSLSVVLFIELDNKVARRMAGLRINYSWERLGWNLLLSPADCKKLASELKLERPYRVKEFLENTELDSQIRLQILDGLRYRVSQLEQVKENVNDLDLKNLFNRAFRYSPARLKKVRAIQAKRKSARKK